MNRYFLTFGQKYRHEDHPSGWPIDPDGYVAIMASSEYEARQTAFAEFGPAWAMLYSESEMAFDYFPLGNLGTLPVGELAL